MCGAHCHEKVLTRPASRKASLLLISLQMGATRSPPRALEMLDRTSIM